MQDHPPKIHHTPLDGSGAHQTSSSHSGTGSSAHHSSGLHGTSHHGSTHHTPSHHSASPLSSGQHGIGSHVSDAHGAVRSGDSTARSGSAHASARTSPAATADEDRASGLALADRRRLEALLSSVPPLLEVLSAQLDQTNRTTESAVMSIMERLNLLEQKANQILEAFADQPSTVQKRPRAPLGKIEESLHHLRSLDTLREQRSAQAEKSAEAMRAVATHVEAFTPLVSTIRSITGQTNILALNATIEASRAGEAGRVFSVVAHEIKALSDQIASTADRIDHDVALAVKTTHTQLDAIAERSQSDNLAFTSLLDSMKQLASQTQQEIETIRTRVQEVLGHVQFQDITRQQIEHIQHGLSLCSQRMTQAAHVLSGDDPVRFLIEPLQEALASLQAVYTMSSQRSVHQAVLGAHPQEEAAALPTIQLF